MKRFKRYVMVIGVLVSAFAGGAVSQWVMSSGSQAFAAPKSKERSKEDALRWSLAKPVFTRKLTVGEPKAKTSATMDGAGVKLFDSRGKVRIRLESTSGNMVLVDTSGKDRVKFGAVQGGQTGISLQDASGRQRIQLDPNGLKIFNTSGKEIGVFGIQSDGTMGLSVADKSGKLKRLDLDPKPAKAP